MRCVDVIQELAVPTGRLSSTELAEHVAACPRCATESARAAQLDRLWEASRPAEPTSDHWESLWAEVAHRIDRNDLAPEEFVPRPQWKVYSSPMFRRHAAVVSIILAQAAAVWIAVLLTLRTEAIEIEPGQPVIISSDEQGLHVHNLPWNEDPNASRDVDPYLLMLNAFEGGMDFSTIASAE